MENQYNYINAEIDSLALVTIGEIEPSDYLSTFTTNNTEEDCIGFTDWYEKLYPKNPLQVRLDLLWTIAITWS